MSKFEDVFGGKARLTDPAAAPAPGQNGAPDKLAELEQDFLSRNRTPFAGENEDVRNLLLDASKAAIGKLVDPMNNALRAIEAEKSEKIRIQTMLDKARNSYNRLRTDVTDFEQRLANSSSECVALRRDLAASEKQLKAAQAAKAEVEKDIAARRKQIADLAGRLALQTNEAAALRDDNRRLDERLSHAERGVIAIESELISARQRLSTLEDERRAQQSSLDKAAGEVARMSRRLIETEAALKAAQDRLRQLEGDFASAHADRARLITAMDEANERHQHEVAHLRKQLDTLQTRAKANEMLLVEARDRLISRAEEARAHEQRAAESAKERDTLKARVAELEAEQITREAELKKAEQARAVLMERSAQLTSAVSAKDAALARVEQSNATLSECVSRLEAALNSEKRGASGIVGELEMALRREKMERQAAESAVEAVRKDFDRLMRKVMTSPDEEFGRKTGREAEQACRRSLSCRLKTRSIAEPIVRRFYFWRCIFASFMPAAADRRHQSRSTGRPGCWYRRGSGRRSGARTGFGFLFGRRRGLRLLGSDHQSTLPNAPSPALIQRKRRGPARSARLRSAANKEGLPLRAAPPLSGRGPVAPAFACRAHVSR